MCGIIGFTGYKQATSLLLECLSKLEYRGYDSSGIAVSDYDGKINVIKAKGNLEELKKKIKNYKTINGNCGIGHTRWATHGDPSIINAHPHSSDDENIFAVHNGIVENYLDFREELTKYGYKFYSQTDTEITVKLIDYYYKKYKMGPIDSIKRAILKIRGSYAICIIFKDYANEIYVVRKESPIVIGITKNETYVASDISAFLKYTRNVYYINDMEIAKLEKGNVTFYDINGNEIKKEPVLIKYNNNTFVNTKYGYEHFMLKEINEQPNVIKNTIKSIVKYGFGLTYGEINYISKIYIVACGSAYHVGMAIQYVIEDFTSISVRVELASEFRYRKIKFVKNSLVIIISQSGETADSFAALKLAKANGVKTFGIINVVGSSIAREVDNVFYTLAGHEISVATTKAYSTQLISGYLLAIHFALTRREMEKDKYDALLAEIETIPEKIDKILDNSKEIQIYAKKLVKNNDLFFIGRGVDYAISLEGSLKMKEISYIHSEAYAAGELKHGPISIIEKGFVVICILTQPDLYEKTLNNMIELKSRGASLIVITNCENEIVKNISDFIFYIPEIDPHFSGSLSVIPLQLLGYYVSLAKGCEIDKPRNLAKSVTVE